MPNFQCLLISFLRFACFLFYFSIFCVVSFRNFLTGELVILEKGIFFLCFTIADIAWCKRGKLDVFCTSLAAPGAVDIPVMGDDGIGVVKITCEFVWGAGDKLYGHCISSEAAGLDVTCCFWSAVDVGLTVWSKPLQVLLMLALVWATSLALVKCCGCWPWSGPHRWPSWSAVDVALGVGHIVGLGEVLWMLALVLSKSLQDDCADVISDMGFERLNVSCSETIVRMISLTYRIRIASGIPNCLGIVFVGTSFWISLIASFIASAH